MTPTRCARKWATSTRLIRSQQLHALPYLPPQKLKNIPEKIRIFLVHPNQVESPVQNTGQHRKLAIRVAVGVVLLLLAAWLTHLLLRR